MLVFKHTRNTPASWLLHMLHPLPGMLFPQVFTWFTFLLWILLLKCQLSKVFSDYLSNSPLPPSFSAYSLCLSLFSSITSENLPNWHNYPLLQCIEGSSQVVVVVKTLLANAGDAKVSGSSPRLERSPGKGKGKPLYYSCLENSMDRGAWWVTICGAAMSQTAMSQTRPKRLNIHIA